MSKAPQSQAGQGQRVDQWLWYARITKSRTLAQALIERGKVRVNKQKIERSSYGLKAGDTITLSSGPRVRVFTVKAFGVRRGPALEAQALYEELTPAADGTKSTVNENADTSHALASGIRPEGAGRPTKRERRQTERLKDRFRDC